MTNSKMFFLLFFCSTFSQNLAFGSSHEEREEFDPFNPNNDPQDKTPNQSFRKTSSVTPLNPESLEDPFFEIEGLNKNNKENSNPNATPTPLSDSFTRQNTPSTPQGFSTLTADELAARIAFRLTPEEAYRKLRRRASSTFSTSATPDGQS